MNARPTLALVALSLSIVTLGRAAAQDANSPDDLKLETPTGWSGERIALPPTFAGDMQLKGIEEIRFAPGMFDAKSDSFFSYAFVFRLGPEPELTEAVIRREILTYYRGLSVAVLKGRDIAVDPSDFTLKLTVAKPDAAVKRPAGFTSFQGDLNWVEPFATRKRQTLHLDLEAWQDADAKHRYLFVLASPHDRDQPVWATMRKIRASFHQDQNTPAGKF